MATLRRCERAFKYLGHFTPSVPPNHNISTDFCQLRESTRLDGLAQTNRAPRGWGGAGCRRGGRRPGEGVEARRELEKTSR